MSVCINAVTSQARVIGERAYGSVEGLGQNERPLVVCVKASFAYGAELDGDEKGEGATYHRHERGREGEIPAPRDGPYTP